jgi:hypothetical protein
MTPTSNHCLNYWLKTQTGDEPLTLEKYIAYAHWKDIEDLDPETLAHATREFEEAISQLRGEE